MTRNERVETNEFWKRGAVEKAWTADSSRMDVWRKERKKTSRVQKTEVGVASEMA